MGSNSLSVIRSINLATLTPIVCKCLHRDWFQIQTWKVSQLHEEAGNPVSLGLYRFEGTGHDQENQGIPWSVILKIVLSPANVGLENFGQADGPTHWNDWNRESLAYSSGLLETSPIGMEAPCSFGIAELPGDIILLWLEDVRGSSRVA
jgi:hypothetical protein